MKKYLLLSIIVLVSIKTFAQNADEIIYNQYKSQYNYIGSSFIIDSGTSLNNAQKRGFLIWANNLQPDTLKRNISLSEYDPDLNFLTENGTANEQFGSVKNMFPKKIIKSKFERAYYLLSYVTSSNRTVNGFKVYSAPAVYKIDANTLGIIWARRINLTAVNANNLNTVIEYNDIIETSDKNIVLVGKYAKSTQSKESILATKLKNSSGAILWQYTYNTGNACNEAANSVTETTDGKLSLTGYVKKCTGRVFSGNADVFYMQLQPAGYPVGGAYTRYFWPSGLNLWGDKITCYTSVPGKDQLIISGYVDVQTVMGAIDRQILIMNIKQGGILVTAQHIGGPASDVCNDLIFNSIGNSDYLIYFTGQTANGIHDSVTAEAYFSYANFNITKGVTSIGEFSTYPVTAFPYNAYRSRSGLEIKNAGSYKKFAILATGLYQPATNIFQTYTDVLLRDFNDGRGSCIKQQQPPLTQFGMDTKAFTVLLDTPFLKVYKETWKQLNKLIVRPLCQKVHIDPSQSSNVIADKKIVSQSLQQLYVNPNPAQSAITVSTTNGSKLTGNYSNAVIRIFNYTMQMEKIISISPSQGNTVTISVESLNPGIYRIQLVRGNETLGCSFIKE